MARMTAYTGNTPTPYKYFKNIYKDEDIVYAPGDRGISDERTGVNEPLVYLLFLPRALQSS